MTAGEEAGGSGGRPGPQGGAAEDAGAGDDAPPPRPAEANARLPAPLLRFARLFNRGAFWESHEALEDAWRERGSGFYHGLILYASAFVHAQRGTRHGITAQFEKAEAALEPYRPTYLGVDVEAILGHAERCRRIVEEQPEPPARPWEELIPFPRLEPDAEAVRGDEAELEDG